MNPRHALSDALARALRRQRVPKTPWGARAALAAHAGARLLERDARRPRWRRLLLHLGFLEAAQRTFGRWGMVQHGQAFHPLFLLPDFHGPHFDEALRRLLLPGRGPFVVHLAVTGVCPCACTYCYASAGGDDAPDLGDARLEEIAHDIVRSGIPLVVLGGGEPLTRWARLLRLVTLLAPHCEVRVATSGSGLTAHRARELRAAGLHALAVSLDSADPAHVNTTRGHAQAFEAAVSALRCSAEADLLTLVTTVVDREAFASAEQVERFLVFVRALHPAILVNFLPKFETGRAVSKGGFRSPAEYAPVARRIGEVIRAHDHRATVFLEPLELLMGCLGGGRRQLNIDVRGNATACISGAAFGNILEDDFRTLAARFSSPAARLKRGFFCARIGPQLTNGAVLPRASSERALATFYAAQRDTLFQRLLDVAGGSIAWLLAP